MSGAIMSRAHVPQSALHKSKQPCFMHHWLFKLCAVAIKGMKLLPFHEEMGGAFIPCLWPKHLDGFRPSRLFLIAGKIDHSSTLMQPFYLQRKYKILFHWTEELDNRRQFICMIFNPFSQHFHQKHSRSFFFFFLFSHFFFSFPQGHSSRVYLFLPGFGRRLLSDYRNIAAPSSALLPISSKPNISVRRNPECFDFSTGSALLPSFLGVTVPVSAACFCKRACLFLLQKNIQQEVTSNLLGSVSFCPNPVSGWH